MRQELLFEDDNFTNSKKYFWAPQSLRLFEETLSKTRARLPEIFRESLFSVSPHLYLGGYKEAEAEVKGDLLEALEWVEKFQERVERKKQQIQSLSDGVCSFFCTANLPRDFGLMRSGDANSFLRHPLLLRPALPQSRIVTYEF
jgi:hypothetical protein